MTPTGSPAAWLGLDVGGANLKAAHSSGRARTQPFDLWKDPRGLARALSVLAESFPSFDQVAVTMTGELCDCYPTKADGVIEILRAVRGAVGARKVCVWGIDAGFHSIETIFANPSLAAAANWLALATLAARRVPEGTGLFIDVGSTTTDIVGLQDGRPWPAGRTDTDRLRSGELVYAGVRRTPVCALATDLPWRGASIGLCAELFATTLDVYLTLGEIDDDPAEIRTADGQPATHDAARLRLARMVGADRSTFSDNDACELARAADERLVARLCTAVRRVIGQADSSPGIVVIAGSGEFLARRVARRVIPPTCRIESLAETWNFHRSVAGCAFAVIELALEKED